MREKLSVTIGPSQNYRTPSSPLSETRTKSSGGLSINALAQPKLVSGQNIMENNSLIDSERKNNRNIDRNISPSQQNVAAVIPGSHQATLHPPPLTPAPPFANPAILNMLLRPPGTLPPPLLQF